MIVVKNEKEFKVAVKKADAGEIIWWDERWGVIKKQAGEKK